MTVYGDILVAVNTAVNFLILLLGAKLCGYPAKPWRCLCGGFLGGAYALAAVMISVLNGILAQAASFLLMCMTSFGVRKNALRPSVAAFLMASALAGFVHLAVRVFSLDALYINGGVYFPIGAKILILLAGTFYLAAALLTAGALRHKKGELFKITLYCREIQTDIAALYDTGNTVKDPISGLPVIVVNQKVVGELLKWRNSKQLLEDVTGAFTFLQAKFPEVRFRLLPYKAVGVSGGLLLAFPCKVRIGHQKKTRKVLAAVSPTDVSDGGSYEALIGGDLF